MLEEQRERERNLNYLFMFNDCFFLSLFSLSFQLRKMLEEQREWEQNLNYLFMFKDRLSDPSFERNLVTKMKMMKGKVDHLLALDEDATDGKSYK